MAEILCIGAADALTKTRCVILERAGYTVTPAHDFREVVAACQSKTFVVAVLSQALPMKEKQRINEAVKGGCPTARVLELHNALLPDLPNADGHLRVAISEPEGLVEAVSVLVRSEHKRQKRRGANQQ